MDPAARSTTRRPRPRWRRWLVRSAALLAAVLAALTGLFVWYLGAFGGPAYDTDLAAQSLQHALIVRHPHEASIQVRCEGIRDGSNFFSCEVAGADAPLSYTLFYTDSTDRYRAEGGRPYPADEVLDFAPLTLRRAR